MAITNIALEGFGIAITLLMIFFCIVENDLPNRQSAIFIKMLIVNVLVLISDLLTWIFENMPEYNIMLYMLNFLVYSLGYVITALFTYYICYYISDKLNENRTKRLFRLAHIIGGLCIIAILLVVVSLFNHMYFSFEDGVYTRGQLYFISQLYPIIIMLVNMSVICRYHKILGKHDMWSLLSYGILPVIAMIIQIQVYGITLLYLSTTLSMLIIYIAIHVEKGRRLQKQENELVQMRISIMQSQIQPHFLYNSLTAIYNLCDENPKKAKQAVGDFSDYLRGNIDSLNQTRPIPFETELKHIQIYLKLEQIRFEEKLNVVYKLESTEFMIPSLTVQPLVENAVKHGLGKTKDGGTVTIHTKKDKDCYIICISDDGAGYDVNCPKADGRLHIGISNVRNRLWQMSQATLEIKSTRGMGTTAIIRLPVK